MIHILNWKRLLLDTDPQELARVKNALEKENIVFFVKTTVGSNGPSRHFSAYAAQRYNYTYSTTDRQHYVYYLYVRRRDYARAKKAAWGT